MHAEPRLGELPGVGTMNGESTATFSGNTIRPFGSLAYHALRSCVALITWL
jgi:hypothetical protein